MDGVELLHPELEPAAMETIEPILGEEEEGTPREQEPAVKNRAAEEEGPKGLGIDGDDCLIAGLI